MKTIRDKGIVYLFKQDSLFIKQIKNSFKFQPSSPKL